MESRSVHISFVQTPVKAPGKNASTVFFPEKPFKERIARAWSGSWKSGGFCPISTDIVTPSSREKNPTDNCYPERVKVHDESDGSCNARLGKHQKCSRPS